MQSRYEKYMPFLDGGSAIIPIDYMADVLGIPYAEAACDLQEMASLGYIGYGAYVNYRERTLVLRDFSAGAPPKKAAPRPKATKNTATPTGGGFTPNLKNLPAKWSGGKIALFTVLGIIIISGNLSGIGDHLDSLFYFFRWSDVIGILQNLLFTAAGVGCAVLPFFGKRRAERMEKYLTMVTGRKSMPLSLMAEYAMCSEETVRRDVTYMIKKGYLGQKAHFSRDNSELMLTYDDTAEASAPTSVKKAETSVEDRYDAILKEIHQLNDEIAHERVSERIEQIEGVTAKIFALVREHPEKESEIKTFMSYYLPTTLKLLRAYSVFEKQGVKGENINATLSDIEKILDTLVQGFSRQLDRMFRADALDISTDIEVLETMMEQDGLAGGSAFQTAPYRESK